MTPWFRPSSVLPGFGLTLGFALGYLGLIVLIPLAMAFLKAFQLSAEEFWGIVLAPRVLASYRLTFGASFLAAAINTGFGLIVAWVLVRYRFPGKRLVDALVDLPFALPTAVAGITLTTLYSGNGWLGQYLKPLGFKVAFTPLGIVVALIFISLPFVVRTVQPVLAALDREVEEASASLGFEPRIEFDGAVETVDERILEQLDRVMLRYRESVAPPEPQAPPSCGSEKSAYQWVRSPEDRVSGLPTIVPFEQNIQHLIH